MDQRVVAGIGNVYKSEACFLSGIDPWRPVGSLSEEEAATLGADRRPPAGRGRARRRARSAPGARPTRRPWSPRAHLGLRAARAGPAAAAAPRIRSRGQGDANRTTYWCPACQR